jgi:hypothetical protein
VVAFDLADRGEHLPGDLEGEPRLLVEEEVLGGMSASPPRAARELDLARRRAPLLPSHRCESLGGRAAHFAQRTSRESAGPVRISYCNR